MRITKENQQSIAGMAEQLKVQLSETDGVMEESDEPAPEPPPTIDVSLCPSPIQHFIIFQHKNILIKLKSLCTKFTTVFFHCKSDCSVLNNAGVFTMLTVTIICNLSYVFISVSVNV